MTCQTGPDTERFGLNPHLKICDVFKVNTLIKVHIVATQN